MKIPRLTHVPSGAAYRDVGAEDPGRFVNAYARCLSIYAQSDSWERRGYSHARAFHECNRHWRQFFSIGSGTRHKPPIAATWDRVR